MQYLSQRLAAQPASEREREPAGAVARSQRDRLLDAAEAVIAEKGAAGATIEAVVKVAGVSSVTFYEHFHGKEECFAAAFERGVEEMRSEVRDAIPPAGDRAGLVRAALAALLAVIDAEPTRARLCFVEAQKGGPQLRDRYDETLEALAEELDDPLGPAIVGGLAWLVRERLELGGGGSVCELLPEMIEVVLTPEPSHG
jgi:AcrR family transcriptional regulator